MGVTNRVLLALVLMNGSAYAEQEVGNGGDIVYCENGGNPTYELLDHWEAREYYDLPPILDDLEGDYLARASYVVDRVKANFPKMGDYLVEQLAAFSDNARFVDGVEIVLVPDAYPRMLPTGCVLKQIAHQREPQFPGEKVFLIDNQLWKHLTPGNQAALVLHEIIYRYALRVGKQNNSIKSRYLVGFLAQEEYVNQPEHLQVFASRQVFGGEACFSKGYFKFRDLAIYCKNQEFYPNGNVKGGYLYFDGDNQPVIANIRQTTPRDMGYASFSVDGDLEEYNGLMDVKAAGGRVFTVASRWNDHRNLQFYNNTMRSFRAGWITGISDVSLLTTAGDERVFTGYISLNEQGYVIVPQ